jgi:hypothetical protein
LSERPRASPDFGFIARAFARRDRLTQKTREQITNRPRVLRGLKRVLHLSQDLMFADGQ